MKSEFDKFDFNNNDSPIAKELAQNSKRANNLNSSLFPVPNHTRVLSVTNQKGGVGKTTSTVNLAAALAAGGLNVLVIDMDPQANASTALGIPYGDSRRPSTYDIIVKEVPLKECIKQNPHFDTLKVVPSTIELSNIDIYLSGVEGREYRLQKALREYLEECNTSDERIDYVFIDCPPSMGLQVINSLLAADEILVTIQAEFYALEGLALLNDTVKLIQETFNHKVEITTALLTMYDKRTGLSNEVLENVREFYKDAVLGSVIPRNVRLAEAPSFQETIISFDSRSTGALSYREAALEIAKRGALMQQNTQVSEVEQNTKSDQINETNEHSVINEEESQQNG